MRTWYNTLYSLENGRDYVPVPSMLRNIQCGGIHNVGTGMLLATPMFQLDARSGTRDTQEGKGSGGGVISDRALR